MRRATEQEPLGVSQFGLPEPASIGIRSIAEILANPETTTDHVAVRSYEAIMNWALDHRTASLPLLQAFATTELLGTGEKSQLGYHQDPDVVDAVMGMRSLSAPADTQTTVGWSVEGLSRSKIKPYQHTRFTHTLFAVEHAIVIGENLKLSPQEIALLATAVAYHDTGHAPLSHVGDEVLEDYGRLSHEERATQILRKYVDPEYAQRLSDIILEKPGFGQILKILDTWAYLRLDMPEAGLKLNVPYIPTMFGEHILLNNDQGYIQVDEIGEQALRDLLNARAHAFGFFYTHPNSLALEAMHKKALKILIDAGKLSPDVLERQSDQHIYAALVHDAVGERLSGDLLGGFHIDRTSISEGPYIPVLWVEEEVFGGKSAGEIEQWAQQALGVRDTRDLVVAMPQPPWTKVITVIRSSGDRINLQADKISYFPQQGKIIICVNRKLGADVLQRISSVPSSPDFHQASTATAAP